MVAAATPANVNPYDDFRKLWQDRDLDLRILKESGYARLKWLAPERARAKAVPSGPDGASIQDWDYRRRQAGAEVR